MVYKHPQNQSSVGSSGQTLTTNVSMTLCNWQIRHQTHVSCGRTTFVPNQIRSQINTVPTPAVAWTRAWLLQRGGGVRTTHACSDQTLRAIPRVWLSTATTRYHTHPRLYTLATVRHIHI